MCGSGPSAQGHIDIIRPGPSHLSNQLDDCLRASLQEHLFRRCILPLSVYTQLFLDPTFTQAELHILIYF